MTRDLSHLRDISVKHCRFIVASSRFFGGLAALCVLGGIVAIIWNAVVRTEFKMFEVTFNTGHVGVAFVAIGVLTAFYPLGVEEPL